MATRRNARDLEPRAEIAVIDNAAIAGRPDRLSGIAEAPPSPFEVGDGPAAVPQLC
jgi:hypothetical protein